MSLAWEDESESERSRRRAGLCALDGLLAHVEEWNVRHADEPWTAVPPQLIAWYQRLGGRHFSTRTRVTGAELVEAIFFLQEPLIRRRARLR